MTDRVTTEGMAGMGSEEITREIWLVIHQDGPVDGRDSEEAARRTAEAWNAVAIIKRTITYRAGEGLEKTL